MSKLSTFAILLVALVASGMSGWSPPPPPPSSGTPAIPDSLGTIKVVADSLYWTSAFGAYLTMSDAVYFVTYPDSSYEYSPYSAGWANEYPGISSCYANVYVGSGYKLTHVRLRIKIGATRTFNFRVYDGPGIDGYAWIDSTITLNSSRYVQDIEWYPESLEVSGDSICIEITDDWGQNFTLEYDSSSFSRFYVQDFSGTYHYQPNVDISMFINGAQTVPATIPVISGAITQTGEAFFNSGLYIPNLFVDTLSVSTLQPANIISDYGSPPCTNGIMALTDTCFTSSGDMFVFINGLLTEFVSTP